MLSGNDEIVNFLKIDCHYYFFCYSTRVLRTAFDKNNKNKNEI